MTNDGLTYDQAREELANITDPNARAVTLALLAVTEELVLMGATMRNMDTTAQKVARIAGWFKR